MHRVKCAIIKNKVMSLVTELKKEKEGQSISFKQGSLLYRLTGLKFWEPERNPAPTIKQGSLLIDALLKYIKNKENGDDIIEAIQLWFPSFDDISQVHHRAGGKRKAKSEDESGSSSTEKEPEVKMGAPKKVKAESKPETKKPTPKPKAPKTATRGKEVKGKELIVSLIEAGLTNIWMVGPAGCGKTTLCQQAGNELEIPVTVIPCGAGTSATTFLGYKYPEREGTPFVSAFEQPGIIVLDEFTALEAQVAQIVNAALANGELSATVGTVQRHEECVIIATSNTFGNGADRMYVSNNQLDASTIDRFAGGVIEVDYSLEYESQFDKEVVTYVQKLRKAIKTNGYRKTASTRHIISACKLKDAGLEWKKALTVNWGEDEKACI